MWWYGRGNSGGSWLPEEKKANMWHGRGNSGGSWPPAFPRLVNTIRELPFCVARTCPVKFQNRERVVEFVDPEISIYLGLG